MLAHLCILSNLRAGWIEECAESELRITCNLIILPKQDGALRMIYDARIPNKWFDAPVFTMPDHLSAMIAGGTFFAKTDSSHAYMRWPVPKILSEMFGIYDQATGRYYRWKVLAWGTNIAPFIQQTLMQAVVEWLKAEMPGISAFVYLDDFLVVGRNKHETVLAIYRLIRMLENIGVRTSYKKT